MSRPVAQIWPSQLHQVNQDNQHQWKIMETHQLRITNITQHLRQANLQKVSSFFIFVHLPRCGGIHAANLAKWNSVSAAGRMGGLGLAEMLVLGNLCCEWRISWWIFMDFVVFGDFLKAFAPHFLNGRWCEVWLQAYPWTHTKLVKSNHQIHGIGHHISGPAVLWRDRGLLAHDARNCQGQGALPALRVAAVVIEHGSLVMSPCFTSPNH